MTERKFYIGIGLDSRVFHIGDSTYKIYNVAERKYSLSLSKILEYQRLTNSIASKYENGIELPLESVHATANLKFNPIDKVFYSKIFRCPVSVSDYIGGFNNINLREIWNKMDDLGSNIGDEFGYDGITLGSINVKFFVDDKGKNISVWVTDLCSSIDSMKKR